LGCFSATGKRRWRAGFGIYYSLIDDLAFLLNSLPPYNGSATFTGQPAVASADCVRRTACAIVRSRSADALHDLRSSGVQANAKTPTVNEWNLAVEQQLDRIPALRVAYVGSWGYHGLLNIDPNTIPAQSGTSVSGCLGRGQRHDKSTVPEGAQYIPSVVAPVVATRPNPYLGAGFFWYTEGNNSYNSLQLDLSRRFSKGLEFRASYTWSKNLDINSALTGAQASNQAQMVLNRNDVHLDWGPSALNAAQQVSLSGRYELPLGRGKVLSGWQLNAIVTLLKRFPDHAAGWFQPLRRRRYAQSRPPVAESGVQRIDRGRQSNQWFNPNAFSCPHGRTYGNAGRGILLGPGLADMDLSLFKDVALTERLKLADPVGVF